MEIKQLSDITCKWVRMHQKELEKRNVAQNILEKAKHRPRDNNYWKQRHYNILIKWIFKCYKNMKDKNGT